MASLVLSETELRGYWMKMGEGGDIGTCFLWIGNERYRATFIVEK